MNISQVINSSVISKNNFSPNSQYLLVPKGKNLVLYSLNPSIKKLNKFTFLSTINSAIFSPSSDYFLVSLIKIKECHIRSVQNFDFIIKIKEPIFGIKSVIWSSNDEYILLSLYSYNSIHIFSTKDEYENIEEELDNISINDNSKNNKNFKYIISNIKYQNLSQGLSFSYNGAQFLAIAIRKQIKDYMEIYDTDDYSLVCSFLCNTIDLDNISWSKDNSFLFVWEKNIYDCKLYIYSLSGNLIMINEPYKNFPGITKFNISPNGHYITLGYYDNSIRLFHYLSFKMCKEINPTNLLLPDIFNKNSDFIFSKTVILVEDSNKDDINFNHLYDKEKYMFSVEKSFPKKNTHLNNNYNNDLNYINNFEFSFNSQYLAFTSTKYQHIIMIYNINTFKLSFLLVFETNVIDFAWSPSSLQLVICTETENKIYFFMPQRVKSFKLPINDDDKSKDNNKSINTLNNNKDKDNIYEKNVFYSSDGKRVLFKSGKFTFFLIEPNSDI